MLRYIENIHISFLYRCVESYGVGRVSIDFLYISVPDFCSWGSIL